MAEYPFRQGIDYGKRRGTLGLAFHMAEGGDGTVTWLAQRAGESRTEWMERVRGVSANAVIQSDGTVWQMVDWNHASGSMNPRDRGPSSGFYNTHVIQDVLGPGWTDPNAWSISVELCGFRKEGPTDPQVRAAVMWGRDMQSRFPTLRGAYGHADQTDTKGCPGLTANMRAIFDALGGHGLWTEEDVPGLKVTGMKAFTGNVTVVGPGHSAVQVADREYIPVPDGQTRQAFATGLLEPPLDSNPGDRRSVYLIGSEAAVLLAMDVRPEPSTGVPEQKKLVGIAVEGVVQKSTEILV